MTAPLHELQAAITAALKADPGVRAIAGSRIYDSVPSDLVFPYVSFGPSDEASDDADCVDGDEATLQIDSWSRQPGFPEVRALAAAVRAALRDGVALSANALVYFEHRTTRTFRDPDGLTSHAASTFEAYIERP